MRRGKLAPIIVSVVMFASACAPEDVVVEVSDVDTSMLSGYLSGPERLGGVTGRIGDRPGVAYRIDGADPVIASPVLAGEIGFVPDGSGDLVAFDVETGEVVWRSVIGDSDSSVVVSTDAIFSVSGDGVVRRHDAAGGEFIWEVDLDAASRSSPLLFGGFLWVAVGDELVALDPTSGVHQHSIPLRARADSSPAASGEVIVIGTRANTLDFVDSDSLTVESVELPAASEGVTTYADGVAATPVISGDSVYVGSTSGGLASVSLAGEIQWLTDVGSPIYGSVAVADDVGFVPTGAGRLIAFDLEDGEMLWSTELGDAAYSSPVSVGEVVLVTAENGKLFALDATTGAELWNLQIGESGNYMASTPAVLGSLVVVGSNDGSIVGVDTDR